MELIDAIVTWLTDPANWSGGESIPVRLLEHIAISGASLLIAGAIALPIGLAIGHTRHGVRFAINLANLGRAIPSLAAIGIVVPFTQALDPDLGFSLYPTVIGMVVLAVPPILVNAYAGVAQVDSELVEAARGMGLQERQILLGVEIPIAIPVLFAGFRSAAVQVIATATLGAIYSLGGLGRFIIDGLANQDQGEVGGGVLLVALLAIATEAAFALAQRLVTSAGLRRVPEASSRPAPA
jgi:osmoprotectant transport system permease protein